LKDIIPIQSENIPFYNFNICQWIKIKITDKLNNDRNLNINQIIKFENKFNKTKDIISIYEKERDIYQLSNSTKVFTSIEVNKN
jgi:hypothetical protein